MEEEIPANPTQRMAIPERRWDASHRCNQLPASIKQRERCTSGGQRGLGRNKVGGPVLDVIMTAFITPRIAIIAALLLFGGTGPVSCNKGSPAFQQPWASLARPHKAAAPFRPRPATPAGRRRARGAGFIALKSSGDASGGSGGFQGRDDQRPCASAGTLRNFLLQRAIQTHVYNLYLVRDQPAYEFIQGFLDHQHFKMITVTDFDFKCAFHGSDGLQTDWETYINSLHSEQTKDITVHFS